MCTSMFLLCLFGSRNLKEPYFLLALKKFLPFFVFAEAFVAAIGNFIKDSIDFFLSVKLLETPDAASILFWYPPCGT